MNISAGVVIYRVENGVPLYLILRSYSVWGFAKGKQDEGEDDITTAVREVKEETGIDIVINDKEYKDTTPYNGSGGRKIARLFVAETNTKDVVMAVNEEIGRAEHEEYRWCTFDQANLLLPARLRVILAWADKKVKANVDKSKRTENDKEVHSTSEVG